VQFSLIGDADYVVFGIANFELNRLI